MRRRVLTLVLAGMLALLGIVAVLAYVHNADQRYLAGLKTTTVLVASQDIPGGTNAESAVSGGDLVRKKFPANAVPAEAVRTIGHADSNKVLSAPLSQGQLLLQSMLVSKAQGATSLGLPPGKMAVSVEVCLSADVAGYVQPGAKVALYDTISTGSPLQYSCSSHQPPTKGTVQTKLILSGLTVLSVQPAVAQTGSSSSTPLSSSSGPATSVETQGMVLVTFAVTPSEAPDLITVNNAGEPTLALLTPTTNVSVTGTSTAP